MLIADPNKVAEYRELLDSEVAMLVVAQEITRPQAYMLLAKEQLQHILHLRHNRSGWWSCIALHQKHYNKVASGELRTDFSAEDVAKFALDQTVVARSPEIAVLGAMLRILDADVDIWLDSAGFESHYGRSAWFDVAEVNPLGLDKSEDPNQRNLGESDEDFAQRRGAILLTQAVRKLQSDRIRQTFGVPK